jgi:hypothetical protein
MSFRWQFITATVSASSDHVCGRLVRQLAPEELAPLYQWAMVTLCDTVGAQYPT